MKFEWCGCVLTLGVGGWLADCGWGGLVGF